MVHGVVFRPRAKVRSICKLEQVCDDDYQSNRFLSCELFYHLFLAVDCGLLSVPMNGSSSGNSTVFPNNVLFNCDLGFILNGSSSRMCQANGTWSGLSVTCVGRF